jgi:hypothetical protein
VNGSLSKAGHSAPPAFIGALMRKLLAFLAIIMISAPPFHALAANLTVQGGKESSERNHQKVEREVEAGREQRDRNTLAPLVPVFEWFVNVMEKGEQYMNSKAERGTKAVLLCNDKPTFLSVDCSTSETNRRCTERVYELIVDMGSDIYDICDIPNPDRGFFQPDKINRHANIVIQ